MTDLLPINYLDTWKVARDKINNSFNEVVETVEWYRPHIENWVWYIWNTDTWVKAEWDSISMKVEDWYIWYKSESASWTQIIATSDLKWEQWEPWTPWTPWAPWEPWENWAAATITVWTTSTGTPWSSASVTNSGTSSAAVLNFVIPAWAKWDDWDDGEAATITVWTTTTLPAWSSATVTNVWTSSAAILNFGIPKWDSGSGSGDVSWPSSATNEDIVLFDWTTWKLIKDWNKKLSDLQEKLTAWTWIDITNNVISATWGGGTGDGDMKYEDFERETATGSSITLDLSTEYTPSWNFTINAPATIKDWQVYVLRVNNWATAYTMSLGTNITNLQWTDITLTANAIDMFVFVAIDGELELQKEMPQWWSGDVVWPSSATNEHLAVFDWTTGKLIKDGGAMPTIPTKVSDLNNDSGYLTSSTWVTSVNGSNWAVTVNEPKVSATAPSSPTEWMVWYDTANDVLKTYDGSSWNEVWGWEWNTKTFYLSDTSDLTTAQEAYDRWIAGKEPIIYILNASPYANSWPLFVRSGTSKTASTVYFEWVTITKYDDSSTWKSWSYVMMCYFNISNWAVSMVYWPTSTYKTSMFLATWVNYTTPYTPQYDGSPATKKYVDDNKWIQNDTTGTTSTLANIWRWTQAEYDLLTPDSNTLYIIS